MPKRKKNRRDEHRYRKQHIGKSVFDGNPTLTLNHYWLPKQYVEPVSHVIHAYKNGTPFNKALDQVSIIYSDTISRNKLAEHTLKSIANDY